MIMIFHERIIFYVLIAIAVILDVIFQSYRITIDINLVIIQK